MRALLLLAAAVLSLAVANAASNPAAVSIPASTNTAASAAAAAEVSSASPGQPLMTAVTVAMLNRGKKPSAHRPRPAPQQAHVKGKTPELFITSSMSVNNHMPAKHAWDQQRQQQQYAAALQYQAPQPQQQQLVHQGSDMSLVQQAQQQQQQQQQQQAAVASSHPSPDTAAAAAAAVYSTAGTASSSSKGHSSSMKDTTRVEAAEEVDDEASEAAPDDSQEKQSKHSSSSNGSKAAAKKSWQHASSSSSSGGKKTKKQPPAVRAAGWDAEDVGEAGDTMQAEDEEATEHESLDSRHADSSTARSQRRNQHKAQVNAHAEEEADESDDIEVGLEGVSEDGGESADDGQEEGSQGQRHSQNHHRSRSQRNDGSSTSGGKKSGSSSSSSSKAKRNNVSSSRDSTRRRAEHELSDGEAQEDEDAGSVRQEWEDDTAQRSSSRSSSSSSSKIKSSSRSSGRSSEHEDAEDGTEDVKVSLYSADHAQQPNVRAKHNKAASARTKGAAESPDLDATVSTMRIRTNQKTLDTSGSSGGSPDQPVLGGASAGLLLASMGHMAQVRDVLFKLATKTNLLQSVKDKQVRQIADMLDGPDVAAISAIPGLLGLPKVYRAGADIDSQLHAKKTAIAVAITLFSHMTPEQAVVMAGMLIPGYITPGLTFEQLNKRLYEGSAISTQLNELYHAVMHPDSNGNNSNGGGDSREVEDGDASEAAGVAKSAKVAGFLVLGLLLQARVLVCGV